MVKRRRVALAVLFSALLSPFLAAPAHAAGNDYPYRTDTTNSGDPWSFTKRQCVSFAAWELSQEHHAISNKGGSWGNASHWGVAAKARGIHISTSPKVGAIAQWDANQSSPYYPAGGGTGYLRAGAYGHVAVVTHVYADRSVIVEQYNMNGNRAYSTMHVKAPRYLYIAG